MKPYYKGAFRATIGGVPSRFTMKLTLGMRKLMREKPVQDLRQLEFEATAEHNVRFPTYDFRNPISWL